MALFRRSKSRDEPVVRTPVAAFWSWWVAEGAVRFASAIRDGAYGDLAQEMSDRVAAIHLGAIDEFGAVAGADEGIAVLDVIGQGATGLVPVAARFGSDPGEPVHAAAHLGEEVGAGVETVAASVAGDDHRCAGAEQVAVAAE